MLKTLASESMLEVRKILASDYGIHKISITSRLFDFSVNSFFIEKPYPTLIDVPPDHKTCLEKLQTGLREIGYSLHDIKRIIATHPHFDHFGAAQTISELSGAEVLVGRKGANWFQDFESEFRSDEIARTEFLQQAGASDHEIQEVDNYYRTSIQYVRNVKSTKYLSEGDLLTLSTFVFTVSEVPGHTPWCILLHDVEKKLGFSGDCLQMATSTPLIQRNIRSLQSYNSLNSYIKSLEKIDQMGLQIVLPGHGEIFKNGSRKAKKLLTTIHQRRTAVTDSLRNSELTPARIAKELFPDLLPGRLFNAISEVMAHLEMLRAEGLVHRTGEHPNRYSTLKSVKTGHRF